MSDAKQLQSRRVGAALPDTDVIWIENKKYLDLSGYDNWVATARPVNKPQAVPTFTKDNQSGFVGAVGTATTPSLKIIWSADDMGSLPAGEWAITVTGELDTRPRIFDLVVLID